jgi:hypothetical protein
MEDLVEVLTSYGKKNPDIRAGYTKTEVPDTWEKTLDEEKLLEYATYMVISLTWNYEGRKGKRMARHVCQCAEALSGKVPRYYIGRKRKRKER